ncbi:MAG: hypothetical protein LBS21_09525 [Clostridiales bacterium]|nr:hypothetical protein [Clostridiales bacterium]
MRNNLRVLVTAGGTREDIDTVRSIANHSTGRLGCLISEEFIAAGAQVTLIYGEITATLPEKSQNIKIRTVAELKTALENLLNEKKYDIVIHSMAVSDFAPHSAIDADDLTQNILNEIYGLNLTEEETRRRIKNAIVSAPGGEEKKISSKSPFMTLILEQTPKVIKLIKEIQPNVTLVGFKLTSGASQNELVFAAKTLINENGCDFVLANDLSGISENTHKAILINGEGILGEAAAKEDVAKMIFAHTA